MNKGDFIRIIKNPSLLIYGLGRYTFLKNMDDEKYLKKIYKIKMRKKLNLENPQTFNEKLQWLKLHDRNPLYTTLVDKAEAKKWIAERVGEQYVIPTYGAWDKFDDIDFSVLPDQFVLKTTHDSGGFIICKDKNTLDKKVARKKLTLSLKHDYYLAGREWPYKDVKRKIIAEKYLQSIDHNSGGGVPNITYFALMVRRS